jgi:hypothetical protein
MFWLKRNGSVLVVAGIEVREAVLADLPQIAAVALATGQDEEWGGANPAYMTHLLAHGSVVVGVTSGSVIGFGATRQLGSGPGAVSMLCDLFVDPRMHGSGCGRAMLAELWPGRGRRMTFSSLHAHALPLYTSFGLDAWWPLLYLRGRVDALAVSAGWRAEAAAPAEVAALELAWTGVDRSDDHLAWAQRPGGAGVLAWRGDRACVCLPGPHPAVRALLAVGWRVEEFDLFMATEPGLLDPRRAVPSPALA